MATPPDDQTSLLDDPTVVDPEETIILTPVDEDDMPDDGNQNPDPGDILQPVIEADIQTPSDGNQGDVILPVDQIETDADNIWIDFDDDAGLGYSEIEDFQAGQDVLHILIDPKSVMGDLDLKVKLADNGLDSKVYLEQQLVAILKGAATATTSDIQVEIGEIVA